MESEGPLVRSIYYGSIGSEATEELLESFGRDGSFLLRDSETVRGAYCLCVRKAPYVHTYRIVHYSDGWCVQDSRVRSQPFSTVETLIQNYSRTSQNMPPLTDPLAKTQLGNISEKDVSYMEMSSDNSVH